MEFCPVLVQISKEIQHLYKDAKYLLQVWSKEKKFYEKILFGKILTVDFLEEVTVWAICYDFFLFKTEGSDENSDYFHLIDLKNDKTYLIEDFVKDPEYKFLSYNENIFYIASSKSIQLFLLDLSFVNADQSIISPSESEIATITPDDMKIHGLLLNNNEDDESTYILVALETIDNQIDFNTLEFQGRPPSPHFQYEFKQFREVVPRNDRFDPVTKFVYTFDQYFDGFAVALRESSCVDFYFSGQRVSSITEPKDTIQYVDCSFDETYVMIGKSEIRAISHELTSRICIESSDLRENLIFEYLFHQKIKNHCKLFSSFVLVKTSMLITHGKIVSFYIVLKQRWIKHFTFDHDVLQIFRQEDNNKDYDLCVLLSNGQIVFINQSANVDPDSPIYDIDKTIEDIKVEGKICSVSQDREDNNWTFILTKPKEDENTTFSCCLNILHKRKMHRFTDEVFSWLNDQINFVFLFSPNDKAEFIMQIGDNFRLFELFLGDEEPVPKVSLLWQMDNIKNIRADIHSGIRFKNDQYMFLVDQNNFHKINILTNEVKTYSDQNCIGLFFSDNNYMYTLCHKGQGMGQLMRPAGFRLYDIENVIDKDQDLSYLLSPVQVGCQGLIDFSKPNQRLVFLSSYQNIEIVPVLHRNTISFIGMKQRSYYLAARLIQDKFIVLDKRNLLSTWGVLTGKSRMEWNLKQNNTNQDYKNFEVYKYNDRNWTYYREWFTKILLKSKTPIPDYDENTFFDPTMTKSHFKHQQSYIKKSEKNFYEFKLIEIINEREVKEHLSFIHPFYEDKTCQNIFISEDTEFMYEHLSNQRYFLYKKESGPPGTTRVTWQKVHRFTSYPFEFSQRCLYPFILSKDFSMYLDVYRKSKKFMIRNSFTQEIMYEIPEWLMEFSSEEEHFTSVGLRFMWVDNDTVRIVNSEGFERLIDLKNNFKELEFNKIPLFQKSFYTRTHYYLNPPTCEPEIKNNQTFIFNSLERLKRKYQNYKSAFNLEKKTDASSLYQVLHSVDYSVDCTKERFVADLSFTFLHWNLIEQLQKEQIEVSQIDGEQIERLIYNILPGGDTFLHMLADKSEVVEEILKICHPNEESMSDVKYEVPFLINFEGNSPMDILKKKKDFKGMDMMLQYLSGYGIDHHSRAIERVLPSIVERKLPSFGDYLDSRLQQTGQISKLKKGFIRETNSTGISIASFWMSPNDMSKILQPAPIEEEIKLEFVDIPNIHTYTSQVAEKFFEAIAETDDMDLFNKKAIRKIIEYKWPLTREYTVKKLFIPFVLFLSVFLLYMNLIFYKREESQAWLYINYATMAVLLYFIYYFLSIEKKQLQADGLNYLKSVWNYLDLIPPLLLLIFLPLAIIGVFDDRGAPALEACLQATMSLILWLKFLYFLRIFKSTGYLIKIIVEVCVDMRHFLLILLLTIIAFGDAMRSIASSNEDTVNEEGSPNQFVSTEVDSVLYIYRMILGDFDTSSFGEVALPYVWILFVVCTVFNMIIMLNLLIAIISESFARINEVSTQASYQEKAGIIAENAYLIPRKKKLNFCEPNQYILIATDVEQEMKERGDAIEYLLEGVLKRINNHANKVQNQLKDKFDGSQSQAKQDLEKLIESVKKDNNEILGVIKSIASKLPPES